MRFQITFVRPLESALRFSLPDADVDLSERLKWLFAPRGLLPYPVGNEIRE